MYHINNDRNYNGYTNYETWCVSLWLDNEQNTQEYWAKRARYTIYNTDNRTDAILNLADELKETIESDENCALAEPNMYADLLRAALSEVNWREIAENMCEGVETAAQ